MNIKTEELLSAVGFEANDEATLDDVKSFLDSKYVLRENVLKDDDIHKKVTGKVLGSLTTKAAQIFGLTASELKDKQLVDVMELAKQKTEITLQELKEQAGKGNDKKVEELQKLLEQKEAEKRIAEDGLKQWEERYNAETGQWETKLKSYKLNDKVSKVKETLKDKFVDDYFADELKRVGFETLLNSKYEFDLDEKDNPIVKSKADGSIVKSKKTVGHVATLDEVYLTEMEAANILKKNNAKKSEIISTFAQAGDTGGVKINAKAAERIAELQAKR